MKKNRIIASIEVGSSKISTLIAQVQVDPVTYESTINIVGAASGESRGVKKGQIVDIEETVEATVSSVEAAERMAGYNIDSAFIALGGAHILSQNSHGVVAISNPDGEIGSDDVARAMEAASAVSLPSSREVVHVLPREFIVDGESGVKDPIGMTGVRLEVETHLVTASSAAIKNLKKAINEVGIDIEGIVFSAVASAEAAITATEKELGCVLIDIGGGTTSVVAYIDGGLAYSGVIPIGAKNVTNDLAIGLRVSLEGAEKIKLVLSESKKKGAEESDQIDISELGVSEVKKVSKKTLIEGIIRPRLNEIFTMVRLELEKAGINARVPSGAVITGGGAMTIGAVDCAKRVLALPVRIGQPRGVSGLVDDILNPAFTTAIGLILYGAKVAPTSEGLTIFARKIKLPTKGIFGKLIESIKNLLP